MADTRELKVDTIRQVVLVGAGTMGEGIAQCFAQAGIKVKLLDQTPEILDRCLKQIEINIQQFFDIGLLYENPSAIKSRMEPLLSTDLQLAVKDCDIVVEIIPEIL